MNFQDNIFVANTMYSNYNNNTLSINPSVANEKLVDKEKYKNNIEEEKNYLYYKVINLNFKFQKVFKMKLNFVSLHIGDIIDYITKKTGIKKLIIKLTNGNCGCEARRIKFNKWFQIPIISFKFDKLNYKNEIDIAIAEEAKEDDIKQEQIDNKNEEIFEQIKLNMMNKQYNEKRNLITNNNSNYKPTNKKPGGCGCGANKNFTKRVNHV
jgi:hypothetical protein